MFDNEIPYGHTIMPIKWAGTKKGAINGKKYKMQICVAAAVLLFAAAAFLRLSGVSPLCTGGRTDRSL